MTDSIVGSGEIDWITKLASASPMGLALLALIISLVILYKGLPTLMEAHKISKQNREDSLKFVDGPTERITDVWISKMETRASEWHKLANAIEPLVLDYPRLKQTVETLDRKVFDMQVKGQALAEANKDKLDELCTRLEGVEQKMDGIAQTNKKLDDIADLLRRRGPRTP